MSSTFEGIRSITGTKRPGGNHGCKLVEVIPNIYVAHFEDISKPGIKRNKDLGIIFTEYHFS